MTSPGHVRTAKARASRTRAKHDRWIRELSAAGWTVIQAGHISVHASVLHAEYRSPEASLHAWCDRCDKELIESRDQMDAEMPLPQVLAKVNGHVCEERS